MAWIASTGDDQVRRVESNPDPVVIGTIPVGDQPNGISLGKQLVWVTNSGDDTRQPHRPRARRPWSARRSASARSRSGSTSAPNSVWVTNHGDGTVTRIDSSTAQIVGSPIEVGKGPRGVIEGLGSVWVANADDGTVSRLDPKTGEVTGEPIRVGQDPRELTVGAGFVWVANAKDNTVSQIDPKTESRRRPRDPRRRRPDRHRLRQRRRLDRQPPGRHRHPHHALS